MSVEVITFGCRLNAFESEVIRHEAEGAGLSDTIVINSCAVTNEAVAQVRQSIRKLKRARPEARIVWMASNLSSGTRRARHSVTPTSFATCLATLSRSPVSMTRRETPALRSLTIAARASGRTWTGFCD